MLTINLFKHLPLNFDVDLTAVETKLSNTWTSQYVQLWHGHGHCHHFPMKWRLVYWIRGESSTPEPPEWSQLSLFSCGPGGSSLSGQPNRMSCGTWVVICKMSKLGLLIWSLNLTTSDKEKVWETFHDWLTRLVSFLSLLTFFFFLTFLCFVLSIFFLLKSIPFFLV